jgi:putative spermidine/putrescine transport system substrate-binding protein
MNAFKGVSEKLLRHRLSRREFTRRAAALGLTASTVATGRAAIPARARAQDKGTLGYWGAPIEVPGDDWSQVEEDLGYKIFFQDNGSALGPVISRLAAGGAEDQFDIVSLNRGAQRELAAGGFIVEVDPSRVENAAKAHSYWPLDSDLYKYEGKLYGIPIMGNGDSVAYLPDRTSGVIDSYGALFDPEFKGRTALEGRWSASMQKTATYLKFHNLAAIDDPSEMKPEELTAVADFLIEHKKNGQFRTFWNGWEDAITLMGTEEVIVMDTWEPVVYALREQGMNVEYAEPKEGYMLWLVANYLLKSAVDRGQEQAYYDMTNYQFGGWYGATITGLRGYITATSLAQEYAKEHPDEFDYERIKEIQDGAERKFQVIGGYWENMRPEYLEDYEREFQRVLSA